MRKYLTESSAKILANSLILPYFDYCSCAWSNCSQTLKDVLIKQHKKMARVVRRVDHTVPTNQVLGRLRWMTLEERWRLNTCKAVFKTLHGNMPEYVQELITPLGNIHSYRTRNTSYYGLIIPQVKTQAGKKSFSHYASCIWNQLPAEVRNATSLQAFVRAYISHLG